MSSCCTSPSEGKEDCGYSSSAAPPLRPCPTDLTGTEYIYHICPQKLWVKAVRQEVPYFPATFQKDGIFMHASTNKDGMVDMANRVHATIKTEEWICLELNFKAILQMGIVVLPREQEERTTAEEEKTEQYQFEECLKVYGGITTTIPGVVEKIYSMDRTNCGTFVGMVEQESTEDFSMGQIIKAHRAKQGQLSMDERRMEDMFRAQQADASPPKAGKKKKNFIAKRFGIMLT